MYKSLCRLLVALGLALLAAACNKNSSETLEARLQNPRIGDVYVIQFVPYGKEERRYYFYQVYAVQPDAVRLHPARQDAAEAQADLSAPGFFSDKTMVYTRAEALELLQVQPGDAQQSQLVQVRRDE